MEFSIFEAVQMVNWEHIMSSSWRAFVKKTVEMAEKSPE
jgi:hypothetical protein